MAKICDAQTVDAVWEQIIKLEVKFSSNFLHFNLIKSHIHTTFPIPSAVSPTLNQLSAPLMSICTQSFSVHFQQISN